VIEKSGHIGGLSRTVNYKGNRMDIGGHRFFSKSDRVTLWWLHQLPLQDSASAGTMLTYRNRQQPLPDRSPVSSANDEMMLVRPRKSRIYFGGKFFDYPISLSPRMIRDLGWTRVSRIGLSYLHAVLFPPEKVITLEDFFISRFGSELYKTFFKSYTEKVWGMACRNISADWGEQRIRNLSVRRAMQHFVGKQIGDLFGRAQNDVSTSLIEQFLYPKLGPGQLWETVARKVIEMGGTILSDHNVVEIKTQSDQVTGVTARDRAGKMHEFRGDCFFSTMPIPELIEGLDCGVPAETRFASGGLCYRDFITVGLLLPKLQPKNGCSSAINAEFMNDTWLYLQDPTVRAGRVQIFNNWSPYLVSDPNRTWIGVEYFCDDGDSLWRMQDDEIAKLAAKELASIHLIEESAVLDSTVIRVEKAYPAYWGTYDRFPDIRQFVDSFQNLFLIGRNGMHKYNNQDHSMLTAMVAVDNIVSGRTDKSNIWEVNTEPDYHEEKTSGMNSESLTKQS
jgi:protoporphyrinogen oxidase